MAHNTDSNAHETPYEIDFNNGDDFGRPVLVAAGGTAETAAYQENNGIDAAGVATICAGTSAGGFATGGAARTGLG